MGILGIEAGSTKRWHASIILHDGTFHEPTVLMSNVGLLVS